MGSGTSKTKRPRLRIRKPLSDQDWRDWANEVHAGHMRATDMQNHRGQWITLRANTQAGVLEYFEGGEWRGLGYGGGGGGTALSGARAGARAGGGADLPNHNLLPGLQGGAPWRGEYYHFQRAAHDELARFWDGGQWDLSGLYMADGHVDTLHVRQAVGIGAGAEASPAYALHVQKSVAGGDQRIFAYLRNPSAEHTAFAALTIEADTATATANLVMFAGAYDGVTDGVDTWGGKAAVYSGIGANAMVVAAQYNAPIEFWVEEHIVSPPSDTWYHIANITKDGIFPDSDGDYALGADALRWSAGFFDALAVGNLTGYIIGTAGLLSAQAGVPWSDLTGVPSTFPPTPHDLLSTSHPDTLAGSVVRGDLVVGNSTPKWARLAKGTSGQFLKMVDANDPGWAALPTASTSAAGIAELADITETSAGTDATRAVTPDGLAGSIFGKKIYNIKVFDDVTALSTGDGRLVFTIPADLNGMNLVDGDAAVSTVSSSGLPTIQIRNVTDAHDMLSTPITIDANEYSSFTAATQPVINASYDDVATGDRIAIDVDAAGTGAKGLEVILVFQKP
jgi:hypothetical protein